MNNSPAAGETGAIEAQTALRAAPFERLPVIEVLGPWVANKGDALMLEAVVDHFATSANLVASPGFGLSDPRLARVRWGEEYREETREALGQVRLAKAFRSTRNGVALSMMSPQRALPRGAVAGRHVDVLFDCSGFAYGDQWTTRRPVHRLTYYRKLKRQGTLLVMLPQALGPFERPDMHEAIGALLDPFDLVFARDAASVQHVRTLDIDHDKVRQAPDISHLVDGTPPRDREVWADRVALVPNARMLDTTDPDVAACYLDFLVGIIAHLRSRNLEPWLVLHEANDAEIVGVINERAGTALPVLDEDAVTTKGILNACRLTISSRFHAIVSCLSSGTPVIGTSWSHKYRALFDEYDSSDLLASPTDPVETVTALLDRMIDPQTHSTVAAKLSRIAEAKKASVEAMWAQIDEMVAQQVARPSARSSPRSASGHRAG